MPLYSVSEEDPHTFNHTDASKAASGFVLEMWNSDRTAPVRSDSDKFSVADWTCVPNVVSVRPDVGAVALSAEGDVIYVADGQIGRRPWKDWRHGPEIVSAPTIRVIALRGAGESTEVGAGCGDEPLSVLRPETGPGYVTALALSEGECSGMLFSAECFHGGSGQHAAQPSDDSGPERAQIRCWCIKTGQSLYVISSGDAITGLSLAKSGKFLVATCNDSLLAWAGKQARFSRSKGAVKCAHEKLGSHAASTAITFDGRRVYAGTHSGAILAFAPKDGKLVQTIARYQPETYQKRVPARRLGQGDGYYSFTEERRDHGNRDAGRRAGHSDWVCALAMASKEFFSCSRDNTIQCWASHDGTHLRTISRAHNNGTYCIAWAAGWLVSSSIDNVVNFWRSADGLSNDDEFDEEKKVEPRLALDRVAGNRSEKYGGQSGRCGLWGGEILLSADGNVMVTRAPGKSIRVWTW